MNRFKKIAGSILLAASLTIGSIGAAPVQTPAQAAETTFTFAEFKTAMDAIGAKISEIATAKTLKTSTSGSAVMMGATLPILLDMDVDNKNMVGHGRMPLISFDSSAIMEMIAGNVRYEDLFMDLAKSLIYIHDEKMNLDFINLFNSKGYMTGFGLGGSKGNMFTSLIDVNHLEEHKDNIIVDKVNVNLGDINLDKISLDLTFPKGIIGQVIEGFFKSEKVGEEFKQYADKFNAAMFADIELKIKTAFYVTADFILHKIDFNIEINGIKFGDMDLGPITINTGTDFSATDEPLVIPEERVQNAVVSPGYQTKAGGVNVVGYMDKKGKAGFVVSAAVKKNAKKVVVPATANAFGKDYEINDAMDNAFKGMKKLKTLVVKNASLKKKIKKKRAKFGLNKKVEIK